MSDPTHERGDLTGLRRAPAADDPVMAALVDMIEADVHTNPAVDQPDPVRVNEPPARRSTCRHEDCGRPILCDDAGKWIHDDGYPMCEGQFRFAEPADEPVSLDEARAELHAPIGEAGER